MSMMNKLMEDARTLGIVSTETEDNRKDYAPLVVAPLGSAVPDDGFLNYVTFDTFREILEAAPGSVLLFRDDQAAKLKALCENADALEVSIQALYGLPATDYLRWFDEAVFAMPRLAYSPLVSELRENKTVLELRKAKEPVSVHQREVKQRTRGDGSVRYHDGEDDVGLAEET